MIFLTLLLATASAADTFGPTDLACAESSTATLSVDTARVRWPFKAAAARLALEAKAQDDARRLECSRIQAKAADTARQDATAFVAATTAVEQGRTVSLDARAGQVATDEAAPIREFGSNVGVLGGYGYGSYAAVDAQLGWNLGFLEGQTVGGVTAPTHQAASSAAARREEAADTARQDTEAKAKAMKEAKGS